MDLDGATAKVQELSDLELAMLLCMMNSSHGIIQTHEDLLDDLESELSLAAEQTFGLSFVSAQCTNETTLDDFSRSILVQGLRMAESIGYSSKEEASIPNVVIVRDLHLASRTVQMQAMELLKSRRIFTHTAMHAAPKHFLMLVISAEDAPPLSNHLRDYVYLSHVHDPGDGFPNLEDDSSIASVDGITKVKALLSGPEIDVLAKAAKNATVTVEVVRYIQDVAVFLRMHRAVAAGTTPLATRYFVDMCKSLAILHNMHYVTPSLVVLAVKKVFRHRLIFVTPATERSMQYGSDIAAVAAFLNDLTPEAVIEDVLATVDCPL